MHQQFLQHFTYLHHVYRHIIRIVDEHELSLPELNKHVSILLNTQHIACCELMNKQPESELTDIHAIRYWEQLENDNFKQWNELFMGMNLDHKDDETLIPKLIQLLGKQHEILGVIKHILSQVSINLDEQFCYLSD